MRPIDQHTQSPKLAARAERPSDAAAMTSAARPGGIVVAPEVAARIVACRVAGESLSAIMGRLHLTPREVWAVLDAAPVVAVPVRVPHMVGEALTGIGRRNEFPAAKLGMRGRCRRLATSRELARPGVGRGPACRSWAGCGGGR
jgi:hypothetical protein